MIVKLITDTKTSVFVNVCDHWVERDPGGFAADMGMMTKDPEATRATLRSFELQPGDVIKSYTDEGVLVEHISIDLQYRQAHLGAS